ncbi:MAG: Wzz/FepE/Etk N-terminal domain-containing protein [bacterium]|nr:Wzz/FepE/Etk N-terminal domain-containing protein [bacterium]
MNSRVANTQQVAGLTPKDYWEVLKRRRWSLLVPVVLVMSIAALVALLLPSIYSSSATIMIEEQQIPSEFVMTTVSTYAEQRVQNIQQRALSFSPLWNIIKEQNLYPDLRDKWTPEEIVAKMRNDIGIKILSSEIFDRRTGRPTTVATAFTVSYEGKSPQAVLRVTDILTSLFLEQNLQVRQQRVSETTEFLEAEAQRVQEELALAERQVAEFKQDHINELPELFQVNKQSLEALERSMENSRTQLRILKEREGFLATQLSSVSPGLENINAQNQREEMLKNLRLQLSFLQERYTDAYPDVASLKAQIKQMESDDGQASSLEGTRLNQLPDNPAFITLNSQLVSTRVEIKSVTTELAALEARAQMYRQRLEGTPKVEENYTMLVNQRNALQAKYNDLNSKHQEARVAQELEKGQKGERFTVLEPARLPDKASKPNRLAIMLIGAILSLGVGTAVATVQEVSDLSIRSEAKLSQMTGATVLASIPLVVSAKELQRARRHRLILAGVFVLALCLAVVVFHFFVMDLDIFWAKVMRRLSRM